MRSARLRRGSGVSRTYISVSFRLARVLVKYDGLDRVTHILHHTNSLFSLSDKLIFGLFDLGPRLLAQILFAGFFASSLTW
jgi:hypothetical protein